MLGDPDSESLSHRLFGQIFARFEYLVPLWIARRPTSLTIVDCRPTFAMFLTALSLLLIALSFVVLFFGLDIEIVSGLWALAVPGIVCLAFLFRGTIRETYHFDTTTGSYAFVRQFIHRREVIEGALTQFTGAYVKTERHDESETYYVILKQEGMFLSGVNEQTLREEVPVLNSFDREARIANAISGFVSAYRLQSAE